MIKKFNFFFKSELRKTALEIKINNLGRKTPKRRPYSDYKIIHWVEDINLINEFKFRDNNYNLRVNSLSFFQYDFFLDERILRRVLENTMLK